MVQLSAQSCWTVQKQLALSGYSPGNPGDLMTASVTPMKSLPQSRKAFGASSPFADGASFFQDFFPATTVARIGESLIEFLVNYSKSLFIPS